jgi:SAM-dependent methyltransferase
MAAASTVGVETLDWYETPRWYDIVFDVGTRVECAFLEEMLRRHGPWPHRPGRIGQPGRMRVLEPACGSGRLVAELARRGHDVLGFDRSPAMLAYARAKLERRGLVARLEEADMACFRFPGRFELAHCLVSTFKYLLDEDGARDHLACVAEALVPGGLYVLGFHLADYADRRRARERWVASRGATTVVCNTQVWPADRRKRLEEVRTRLTVSGEECRERRPRRTIGGRGGGAVRTETRWTFRTYDAREARRLFDSVPALELVALHDFRYDASRPRSIRPRIDDEQLDCVFVLRKR